MGIVAICTLESCERSLDNCQPLVVARTLCLRQLAKHSALSRGGRAQSIRLGAWTYMYVCFGLASALHTKKAVRRFGPHGEPEDNLTIVFGATTWSDNLFASLIFGANSKTQLTRVSRKRRLQEGLG